MIYIAHRGNLSGPNPDQENHPDYIRAALKTGYHVEIDVWLTAGKYVLGHDTPMYEVDRLFLSNNRLWCHAKSIETITDFISRGNLIHCFFHETDSCVLTSRKWIWTYPGRPIMGKDAIAVLPEQVSGWHIDLAGGICSDYIKNYKL